MAGRFRRDLGDYLLSSSWLIGSSAGDGPRAWSTWGQVGQSDLASPTAGKDWTTRFNRSSKADLVLRRQMAGTPWCIGYYSA
jgi:hypothetical protein